MCAVSDARHASESMTAGMSQLLVFQAWCALVERLRKLGHAGHRSSLWVCTYAHGARKHAGAKYHREAHIQSINFPGLRPMPPTPARLQTARLQAASCKVAGRKAAGDRLPTARLQAPGKSKNRYASRAPALPASLIRCILCSPFFGRSL